MKGGPDDYYNPGFDRDTEKGCLLLILIVFGIPALVDLLRWLS